jgi:hypothetical protein
VYVAGLFLVIAIYNILSTLTYVSLPSTAGAHFPAIFKLSTEVRYVSSLEYPTMPPAGSSKVLRAPAHWGGIQRAPKTNIYNLEIG